MASQDSSTYKRIMASAARLFAEKGYEGTTTRQIVSDAEASLSSIQALFQSKERLYQEVLERTLRDFSDFHAALFREIDETDQAGLLDGKQAWDLIVQLTDHVIDWAFRDTYRHEILLINRELLHPTSVFREKKEPLIQLYRYYERLFEKYVGQQDKFWMKAMSVLTVSCIFKYNNCREVMNEVLDCDIREPEVQRTLKISLKKYLLNSMRVNLNQYRSES